MRCGPPVQPQEAAHSRPASAAYIPKHPQQISAQNLPHLFRRIPALHQRHSNVRQVRRCLHPARPPSHNRQSPTQSPRGLSPPPAPRGRSGLSTRQTKATSSASKTPPHRTPAPPPSRHHTALLLHAHESAPPKPRNTPHAPPQPHPRPRARPHPRTTGRSSPSPRRCSSPPRAAFHPSGSVPSSSAPLALECDAITGACVVRKHGPRTSRRTHGSRPPSSPAGSSHESRCAQNP